MRRLESNNESGNVLFYILVAVALLAALSYAVSSSTRDNASSITDQRAALYANEVMEYGNTLSAAVTKLKLRGCEFLEISFDNPNLSLHSNSNAPSDGSCDVFSPAGAAVNFQAPLSEIGTNPQWSFNYEHNIDGFGNNCADVSCKDMVGFISNISLAVCEAINEKAGLGSPPPKDTSNAHNHYEDREYDDLRMTAVNLNGMPVNTPIKSGCIQLSKVNGISVDDTYYFYVVLWPQY